MSKLEKDSVTKNIAPNPRFPLDLAANIASDLLKGRTLISQSDIERAASVSIQLLSACQEELERDAADEEGRRVKREEKAQFAKQLADLKTQYPNGLSFNAFVRYVTNENAENSAIVSYTKFLTAEDETARARAEFPDFTDERSSERRVVDEIEIMKASSDLTDWHHALSVRHNFKTWMDEVHTPSVRREAAKISVAKRLAKGPEKPT